MLKDLRKNLTADVDRNSWTMWYYNFSAYCIPVFCTLFFVFEPGLKRIRDAVSGSVFIYGYVMRMRRLVLKMELFPDTNTVRLQLGNVAGLNKRLGQSIVTLRST